MDRETRLWAVKAPAQVEVTYNRGQQGGLREGGGLGLPTESVGSLFLHSIFVLSARAHLERLSQFFKEQTPSEESKPLDIWQS